ncbi:FAD-binding oxidoreductase [Mobilicoccus pelagius]|uniref:Putative FAD-linked oxidase n=1 Tax=Mobilicoccus pelagius NBRC 104925 TaxID=1089455 RepID=H5UVF4_9MICO|nr:FAD-linked oxidase C-terminal domain-containing protein [Mobilicoccus pelagius]GAB49712.1 putative FAD-linked oxidase [Mobilicoccus pelagius NBRC 104925]
MIDLPSALPRITDPDVKRTYGVDASFGATPPEDFEVVRARDTADVVEAMTYAQAHRIPVVPQGARTGLNGAAVASEGCLVLNTERLNTIETVDPVEGLAVVGPGVVTEELKKAVRVEGMSYPPDPASAASSTIGGNVATNAGGLCCIKYGVTADYIRGLQVVLPGGEVVTTGRRTAKSSAGLDLTGLFLASEGTLGVITEVVTRLVPAPEDPLTALATFDSLTAAAEAIVALRRDPQPPSLLEFLDDLSIAAVQDLADYGFPQGCAAALLVQSDRPGHVEEDTRRYADIMTTHGATDVALADDAQEADALLAGRRALNAALEAKGPNLVEDMCVPIRALPRLVEEGRTLCARHDVEVTMSGHGGDGNLHPSIYFDPTEPDSRARGFAAFADLAQLAIDLGGTISGEHGIGTIKAPYLRRQVGDAALARMRAIKAVFDPHGICNPGTSYTA